MWSTTTLLRHHSFKGLKPCVLRRADTVAAKRLPCRLLAGSLLYTITITHPDYTCTCLCHFISNWNSQLFVGPNTCSIRLSTLWTVVSCSPGECHHRCGFQLGKQQGNQTFSHFIHRTLFWWSFRLAIMLPAHRGLCPMMQNSQCQYILGCQIIWSERSLKYLGQSQPPSTLPLPTMWQTFAPSINFGTCSNGSDSNLMSCKSLAVSGSVGTVLCYHTIHISLSSVIQSPWSCTNPDNAMLCLKISMYHIWSCNFEQLARLQLFSNLDVGAPNSTTGRSFPKFEGKL